MQKSELIADRNLLRLTVYFMLLDQVDHRQWNLDLMFNRHRTTKFTFNDENWTKFKAYPVHDDPENLN